MNIEYMMKIQDESNSRLNPDWKSEGWDFKTAIKVEAAEAADHLGYKWWKQGEPDLAQARMEVIDIWHFLLSWLARDAGLRTNLLTQSVLYAFEYGYNGRDDWTAMESVNGLLDSNDLEDTCVFFGLLAKSLGISEDTLQKLYIGKAALNRFRWQNGYGTDYVKIWDGREDNEHLTEILEGIDDDIYLNIEYLTKRLAYRYDTLVKGKPA